MKIILATLLLFVNLSGRAQELLVESVALGSTENQFLTGFSTNELSLTLLTAFEKGQIDGYSKGPEVAPVLGKERTDLSYPEFESGKSYYASDIVKFKDKYYTANFDTSLSPDQNPAHWKKYQTFEVLGEKIRYPDKTDRISYNDWRTESIVGVTYSSYYQDGVEYFSDDVVFHEGQCYVALQDTSGKTPSSDKKLWKQCDCNIYVDPSMIHQIEIRYVPNNVKDDKTYVTLWYTGHHFLYFRLDEVKNYLNIK